MKVKLRSIVEIDDTDEEMGAAMRLRCVCGHTLRMHSWTTSFWYPDAHHHTLYPSVCVSCNCKHFEVEE